MIEIRHLKKQFDMATPLKDVNVSIHKGDVIAVIGPSGTGKSTLLRCINQLEKPTAGQILVDGEDITDPRCDLNKVRRKLGMVFQSFNLYEHLTVVENCMLAQTTLLKRSRQEAYEKSMQLLESVGMASRALQYPSQLSGGQKQRAAIARTLATDPEIVLFDEPTSALDPLTVGEVEEVISKLAKQGCTMMIVTHSMEFAKNVANRVFYMDQGGIYEEGTPEQIFGNPQRERTRKFIRRLVSLDLMVEENMDSLHQDIGAVYTFCAQREISAERTMRACSVYEEGCSLMFRYLLGEEKKVRVTLEYDAPHDKLSLSLTPYSTGDRKVFQKSIYQSLEYSLLFHYTVGYRQEQADESIGVRYTLDL